MVDAGDGEREFVEFEAAQRVNGSDHEGAAESMALVAGNHAKLSGVADAGRDFAGQHGAEQLIAAGHMQDERRAGNKLAATRKQNNIFQEAQSAGFAAVLVVDIAVDVIGVAEENQFGAGIEVAVVPARNAQAGRRA